MTPPHSRASTLRRLRSRRTPSAHRGIHDNSGNFSGYARERAAQWYAANAGISLSNGRGPIGFHANVTPAPPTRLRLRSGVSLRRSAPAIASASIALRYAPAGIPRSSPRLLVRNASRSTRSRPLSAPGELRCAAVDPVIARRGTESTTTSPATSSKPPATASNRVENELNNHDNGLSNWQLPSTLHPLLSLL